MSCLFVKTNLFLTNKSLPTSRILTGYERYEKNIKNNTSPGDSWKVVAGEDSQWELAPGIGVTLAVMHDYSYHNDDIPRNDLMMLKLDSILQILG